MLSITDLKDFIDLDIETVRAVEAATALPEAQSTMIARQLLTTANGISIVHHMFRDLIAEAAEKLESARQGELSRAYSYFARKYPMPGLF